MKAIKLIAILLFCSVAAMAQDEVKTIKSNKEMIRVLDGGPPLRWKLSPELNPDVLEVKVAEGATQAVKFISDVETIEFQVRVGTKIDFIIDFQGQKCHTRVVGIKADAAKP